LAKSVRGSDGVEAAEEVLPSMIEGVTAISFKNHCRHELPHICNFRTFFRTLLANDARLLCVDTQRTMLVSGHAFSRLCIQTGLKNV
jgi:hypothetical protein